MDLFKFDIEEKENLNDFYNSRSHQDSVWKLDFNNNQESQFCWTCNTNRHFIYDRCEICKSN